MIGKIDNRQIAAQQLAAQQRADIIYAQARSELSDRLWQAALGNDTSPAGDTAQESGLEALITRLARDAAANAPVVAMQPRPKIAATIQSNNNPIFTGEATPSPISGNGLGANARYQGILQAAAMRTGIPAAALAAIVNAEAAKGPDGRWLAFSRNPRSSAAGIGQFLSGTWQSEAERNGSWLNTLSRERGWIDNNGRISSAARGTLLALRYDPDASIQAIADYARANLDRMSRAGIKIGNTADMIARTAYLGHHLGVGDAIKFLANGGLSPERARTLLNAQIGGARAAEYIAASGNAASAHRAWLTNYVAKTIKPARFSSV